MYEIKMAPSQICRAYLYPLDVYGGFDEADRALDWPHRFGVPWVYCGSYEPDLGWLGFIDRQENGCSDLRRRRPSCGRQVTRVVLTTPKAH